MKKILITLLIAVVSLTAVFAEFDISNLNVNARLMGNFGQYGASHDYGKWEFGAELWTKASPFSALIVESKTSLDTITPVGVSIFATFRIAQGNKSDLALGASFGVFGNSEMYEISGGEAVLFFANAEYAFNFNDHHAVTARLQLPVTEKVIEKPSLLVVAPSLGYRYCF